MKPRSAPPTSIAESITSASTSSSTRPDPSARSLRAGLRSDADRRSPWSWTDPAVRHLSNQKHDLGPTGAAKPDPVAVRQPLADHLRLIDERAVARATVLDDEAASLDDDLGVVARHFAARQTQVVRLAAPDGERLLVHRHDTPADRVGDLQTHIRHR